MSKVLEWNTLDQAAKLLSEKTNEEWTQKRIFNFAIEQCRPDDIVEDKQYPTYLRAIQPISQEIYIPESNIYSYDKTRNSIINGLVNIDGELKETTKLYKNNLIELQKTRKTKVDYVFLSDKAATAYSKLMKDAEQCKDSTFFTGIESVPSFLESMTASLPVNDAFPYTIYPGIPYPVEIDIEAVGLREKELKKLLRKYLSIYKDAFKSPIVAEVSKDNQLTSVVTENCTDPKAREYILDELLERAKTEASSDNLGSIFRVLKKYAREEKPPFSGEINTNGIEYENNDGIKKIYTKDALRSWLKRRAERLEKVKNESLNDH